MKITDFRKVIDRLYNNPCVMESSDVYAAGRDYGYDDAEAKELVKEVFEDTKTQMIFSSVFRTGFYRAIIAVQKKVEDNELKEKHSKRKIRAKELMDVLPAGIDRDILWSQIWNTLEKYDIEGI